jgi:hypothetical protein
MAGGSQVSEAGIERNEPSRAEILHTAFLSRILAKLGTAFLERVPLGYEDETGFHLGQSLSQTEAAANDGFCCSS